RGMSLAQLEARIKRLQRHYTPPPTMPPVPQMSALELWQQAMGYDPDPWQEVVLESEDPRIALLCARQVGKSSVVAVTALHIALYAPERLILLLSRSLRQSMELARKVFRAYSTVARHAVPAESETKQALELGNGSRIIALPGADESSIRGFSGVRLLAI